MEKTDLILTRTSECDSLMLSGAMSCLRRMHDFSFSFKITIGGQPLHQPQNAKKSSPKIGTRKMMKDVFPSCKIGCFDFFTA